MADFTLAPDYTFTKETNYKTLVSQFESGVEQRRSKWTAPVRTWKLQYKNRDATDLGTIQTLFDAKLGAYQSFTWTNPVDSVDYTVRFKEDSLSVSCDYYGRYNIEFELIEVK